MTDNHIPNVDVDELMHKIRAEVDRRRKNDDQVDSYEPSFAESMPIDENHLKVKWSEVNQFLSAAREVSQMGTELPPMYKFKGWKRKIVRFIGRGFLRLAQTITRDQREFNQSLLSAFDSLQEAIKQTQLTAIRNAKNLQYVKDSIANDDIKEELQAVHQNNEEFRTQISQQISALEEQIKYDSKNKVGNEVSEIYEFINKELEKHDLENHDRWEKLSWRINEIEKRAGSDRGEIREYVDKELEKHNLENHDRWEKLSWHINEVEKQVVEQLNKTIGEEKFNNLEMQIKETSAKTSQLKTSLLLQERRLTLLLEEARKRLPEPFSQEQLQDFVDTASDLHDDLYLQFEDHFRGTREDIKERQKTYLPIIKEAQVGTEEKPILDIGSGRGEWLELLKEEGRIARGVDINNAMITKCHDMGLEVYHEDLFDYLFKTPDKSVGSVTGFHIVEHLSFDDLIKLLDETVRILHPGGFAIFETPNPQNLIVGACNFYADPTHRNPVHPDTLTFLLEARGFVKVQMEYWNKQQIDLESNEGHTNVIAGTDIHQWFLAPPDYAVVGWRP